MHADELLKAVANERNKRPLLAKDIATEKQKWAVNLCAEYTSAKKFNWERGTVAAMQKYLDKYYTIAKNNYDEDMEDYGLTHDDFL